MTKWDYAVLQRLRERRGWSVTRLAAEIGVSPDSVKNWEAGRTEPNVSTLIALVNALECEEDELLVARAEDVVRKP